ncbi:heme oxygenase-like protein [Gibbsiella quercinecans]|nr:iron-containing redox enzyme family protein [Gibbsiella quercinecans]TCT88973.1 heme oxygenase-like protein [Gibbsiella quercinecans]
MASENMNRMTEKELNILLQEMSAFNKFRDSTSWYEPDDVWKRPVRPQSFKHIVFDDVQNENISNYSTFTMNRILTAMYEMDFLFLPQTSNNVTRELSENYNSSIIKLKNKIIPVLEEKIFGYIDKEVYVTGDWNRETFEEYFNNKISTLSEKPESLVLIEKSSSRELVAKFLLMQHALDFLPESSHMIRYAKGDFGAEQSALFRVLLDEFGYGRHEEKHSTLFKKTLSSAGMYDNSHAYWNFYLNSTLMNNNYFHYITNDISKFFEYVGAITWAENSFGPYCRMIGNMLKETIKDIDVRYYEEHDHIDGFHGRMTLHEILNPLAKRFGNDVYVHFVKGIEVCGFLQKVMEKELCDQIRWMENKEKYVQLAKDIKRSVLDDIKKIPVAYLNEPLNELSVPHVHDGDEFCIVDEGMLRFCHGPDCYTDLLPGDCVVIRKNRLHGALVLSDYCKYRILSIGDYTKYANYKI